MKLGFFTMPMHPPNKPLTLSLAEDREAFILADQLGYSEAFCGSHYTDCCETIPSPLVFLATLADATSNMRLGTATVNLPNHHPVELAADIALLDHLLNGRFNLGISPGGLSSDAEAFGTDKQDRLAMFLECFEIIQKIWRLPPPYNIDGEFWKVSTGNTFDMEQGMGAIPKPLQAEVPVFSTVLEPYSKGVMAAAELGWLPISANFTHPDWLKSHWDMAAQGFARASRGTSISEWRVARSIFVADTPQAARDYVLAENSPYLAYFENLLGKFTSLGKVQHLIGPENQDNVKPCAEQLVRDMVIFGDASEVADRLNALREKTGPFGTLLYVGADWAEPELGRASMRMMAEQVLPKIT